MDTSEHNTDDLNCDGIVDEVWLMEIDDSQGLLGLLQTV